MTEESKIVARPPTVRQGSAKKLRGYSAEGLACFESEFPELDPNYVLAMRDGTTLCMRNGLLEEDICMIGALGVLVCPAITFFGRLLDVEVVETLLCENSR